jgi:hypothetical protein
LFETYAFLYLNRLSNYDLDWTSPGRPDFLPPCVLYLADSPPMAENKLFHSAVGRLSIGKCQFIALYAWNNVAVLAGVKNCGTASAIGGQL